MMGLYGGRKEAEVINFSSKNTKRIELSYKCFLHSTKKQIEVFVFNLDESGIFGKRMSKKPRSQKF